ncbi:hypothetical protein [Halodesulfovibrio aestuarii]|uniref:Uncharacterized protein n=1 Tax=Halodesulfovibrio aestuarii TaxID=126333 RepID=A0ABV4JTI4_9BACT
MPSTDSESIRLCMKNLSLEFKLVYYLTLSEAKAGTPASNTDPDYISLAFEKNYEKIKELIKRDRKTD